MNVDQWFCAILQGDQVIRFGARDYQDPIRYFWRDKAQGSWQLEGPRLPGEYVGVDLGRGKIVGTPFFGLVEVKAYTFTLPQSPAEGGGKSDLREIHLSASQGASVIEALKSSVPYMWKNATESARTILSGTFGEKPEERAYNSYREGRTLYDQGNRVAGLEKGNEAIAQYPRISGVRVWLGQIAIKDGNLELAVKLFTEELQLASDPDEFSAHAYLAAIFRELGHYEQAREHAEAAMATEAFRKTGGMSLSSSVVDEIKSAAARLKPPPAT